MVANVTAAQRSLSDDAREDRAHPVVLTKASRRHFNVSFPGHSQIAFTVANIATTFPRSPSGGESDGRMQLDRRTRASRHGTRVRQITIMVASITTSLRSPVNNEPDAGTHLVILTRPTVRQLNTITTPPLLSLFVSQRLAGLPTIFGPSNPQHHHL